MTTTINVLDIIPSGQHAAIFAATSTYDATADIQAALDDSSPRKRVILPPGQVATSNRLYLHNDTSVQMDRCNLFQLGTAQGGNATASAFWMQDTYNWSITGGRIDGNYANRSGAGEGCLVILNSGEFRIQDMKLVHSPGDGVTVGHDDPNDANSYSVAGIFDNVNCEDNKRHGFSFDGVRDMKLNMCRARNHTGYTYSSGFVCEPSSAIIPNDGVSLIFCEGINNTRYGIYAAGQTAANANVKIVGSAGFKGNGFSQIGGISGSTIQVTA